MTGVLATVCVSVLVTLVWCVSIGASSSNATLPVPEHGSGLPVSEHESGLPVSGHESELPVSEHKSVLPVSEHESELPVSEHESELPVSEHESELPVSEHESKLPGSEHESGLPVSEHESELPVSEHESELSDLLYAGDSPRSSVGDNDTARRLPAGPRHGDEDDDASPDPVENQQANGSHLGAYETATVAGDESASSGGSVTTMGPQKSALPPPDRQEPTFATALRKLPGDRQRNATQETNDTDNTTSLPTTMAPPADVSQIAEKDARNEDGRGPSARTIPERDNSTRLSSVRDNQEVNGREKEGLMNSSRDSAGDVLYDSSSEVFADDFTYTTPVNEASDNESVGSEDHLFPPMGPESIAEPPETIGRLFGLRTKPPLRVPQANEIPFDIDGRRLASPSSRFLPTEVSRQRYPSANFIDIPDSEVEYASPDAPLVNQFHVYPDPPSIHVPALSGNMEDVLDGSSKVIHNVVPSNQNRFLLRHPVPEPEPEIDDDRPEVRGAIDDLEPMAEPAPEWEDATARWGIAWELHIYIMGTLFAVLALLACITLLRIRSYPHLLSKQYFVSLTVMVLLIASCRTIYLLVDPYLFKGVFPVILGYFIFSLPVPSMTSAFAILFFSLLSATQVQLIRPEIQTSSTLACIIVSHFGFSLSVDLIIGFTSHAYFLLALCMLLFIIWGLILCASYWYIFYTLYRSAQRLQAEALRLTITKLQIEGGVMPRRLPRSTLSLAIRLTFVVSLLGLLLAGLQTYGMIWVYDAFGLFSGSQLSRPRAWPWWGFQLLSRAVELLLASLLLYVGSQPLRHNEPHVGRGAGGAGDGDGCSMLALFRRLVHRAGSTLRPKPQRLAHLTESDYYPAICSHNHVVQDASQDGRLSYDDRLALSSLRALPVSMSQRRTLRRSVVSDHQTGATPRNSRPSSFLLAAPLVPPPPPPPPACQPPASCWDVQEVSQMAPFSNTVRSSGTQTSDEYTDVCPAYRYRYSGVGTPLYRYTIAAAAASRRAGLSTPSMVDTEDAGSSAQPTPRRHGALARRPSPCSSESAAHSFDVRLFHGDGENLRQDQDDDGRAAASRVPEDPAASSSSLGVPNFLTDVSTGGSRYNMTDSRELSDSDLFSRDGSDVPPTRLDIPHPCFSLALQRLQQGVDSTSEDITPDSAVVVDYDIAQQYAEGEPDQQLAAPLRRRIRMSSDDSPRHHKSSGRLFPLSSSSLNDILRRYGGSLAGSRNLLERLRGSTFSLHANLGGYHPLETVDRSSDSSSAASQADKTTQTDFLPLSSVTSCSDIVDLSKSFERRLCRSQGDGLQVDLRLFCPSFDQETGV